MGRKCNAARALLVLLAVLLPACGGEVATAVTGPAAATMTGDGTAVTLLGATDFRKMGPELAAAMTGMYKGATVSVFGPFAGSDQVKFNNSLRAFETATGIAIQYESATDFETSIKVRVAGGNAPDIADFQQLGLMASMAKSGKILDAAKLINPDWLQQNYNQGYLDAATVDGAKGKILGGVFQRVTAKGLVWYPKSEFDKAGYKVPTTWDAQQKLMDQIVKDGSTPWCLGIASGVATGWPATDWLENIVLRTTSPANYDKWVAGTLPFTSPEVEHAAQLVQDLWFNPKYVYGGTQQILSTSFDDAPKPMLQNPPKCWLTPQGNFITTLFEQIKPGVKGGVDYDFYYLPPIDPQYGKPVEFGGDLMSAFHDRPEVRAVMQYFSTFAGVKGWVNAGGAISPHKNADAGSYANMMDRKVAQTLLDATTVRFDASDLMPAAVGSGTFWKAMTDWVAGAVDLDGAMQEAQAGWATVAK